ncbi:MAG: tetratricopeptide repeat protein, partial [Nitrospirae bacterium]|nr:tetratricopeptide repeat protein [Nitrospirota bacterium]
MFYSPLRRSGKYSSVIALSLIVITTLLIYSNTFSSSFHFDDRTSIIINNKILDLSNFLDLSGTRYVGELSFALNYHFGQFNVSGYHLVNIVIHIINGLLVWWLVILTFKTPQMGGLTNNSRLNSLIALASSLVFVSHPIQTQAVTYIVQRYASLATLFYLLSVVLFVKWRLSSGSVSRVVFYLFSILSAVLAMKTKEISFTLPFVILLYEGIFFRDRWRRVYHLIPFLLTLPVIPLTIIGTNKPLG